MILCIETTDSLGVTAIRQYSTMDTAHNAELEANPDSLGRWKPIEIDGHTSLQWRDMFGQTTLIDYGYNPQKGLLLS